MHAHTRAIAAATAFTVITGKKVAGVYDHTTGLDLRIAAECKGQQVQGHDGSRNVKFGGTLPEIFDAGDQTFLSCTIDGTTAQGYDRATETAYNVRITDGAVQIFDHGVKAWFAYDMQDPDSLQGYHRKLTENF